MDIERKELDTDNGEFFLQTTFEINRKNLLNLYYDFTAYLCQFLNHKDQISLCQVSKNICLRLNAILPLSVDVHSTHDESLSYKKMLLEIISHKKQNNPRREGSKNYSGNVRNIIRLNLVNLQNIQETYIAETMNYFPNLKTLNLSGSNISNYTINKTSESCKKLESVDLVGCKNVTDESIIRLCKSCKKLKRLNLAGCSITNESVVAIAIDCTNLEYLNLRSCRNITGKAVIEILSNNPKINFLGLSRCGLSNDSIVEIIRHSKRDLSALKAHYSRYFNESEVDVIRQGESSLDENFEIVRRNERGVVPEPSFLNRTLSSCVLS